MTQKAQSETVSKSCPGGLEPVFPFLSHVFSSQSTVPELVEAERELLQAITASEGALDPDVRIRLTHAAIRAQAEPRSGSFGPAAFGSALGPILETFATKLSSCSPFLSLDGIKGLRESGLGSAALVEAVSAIGIAQLLLTLARSSGSGLEWRLDAPSWQSKPRNYYPEGFNENPLLEMPTVEPEELKRSNSILREQYGFLPNLFAIQSDCPEIVKAQIKVLDTLMFGEDHLGRLQK